MVSPELERDHALDDNVVKKWDRGVDMPEGQPVVIDFGRSARLRRIEVCTTSGKSKGVPVVQEPLTLQAEAAEDQKRFADAYFYYYQAGWDMGLPNLADYREVLAGLSRTAKAADFAASAAVAELHLRCL